jgi:hypothetical protein
MRTRSRRLVPAAAIAALVSLAALSGCSSSGSETDTSATTTAVPTTKANATTTAATDDADGEPGGDTTAPAGTEDPWAATAAAHRGSDGKTFPYDCPAGGTEHTIWGTETYTDDSSVCTAAVHVGLISLDQGGAVEIEIAPSLAQYPASSANGIVSVDYGPWDGSFTFPEAPPGSGTFEPSVASWSVTAASLKLEVGDTAEVNCSPDGQIATIYGTGTYTADSYVCTAAVHAGLIDASDGGLVRIEVVKGLDRYPGSTAHDVTSVEWGAFDPAFTFPSDQPAQK